MRALIFVSLLLIISCSGNTKVKDKKSSGISIPLDTLKSSSEIQVQNKPEDLEGVENNKTVTSFQNQCIEVRNYLASVSWSHSSSKCTVESADLRNFSKSISRFSRQCMLNEQIVISLFGPPNNIETYHGVYDEVYMYDVVSRDSSATSKPMTLHFRLLKRKGVDSFEISDTHKMTLGNNLSH